MENEVFQHTMAKEWKKISELYRDEESLRGAIITKNKNTALHIAILSYNSSESKNTGKWKEAPWIKAMINYMTNEDLEIENAKGETPLHLAAAVGWTDICSSLANKNRNLISKRNKRNETPLFVAAHYGEQDVFILLSDILDNKEKGHSLCRRDDGNTALHSALSGENFGLANLIIDYYPDLVHKNNINGESPLHVLAKKPVIFKDVTELGYLDSLICKYALVELRQGHSMISSKNDKKFGYPSNYRTCVNIFNFMWFPLHTILGGGEDKKDVENQLDGSQGSTSTGPRDKQHNDPKDEDNKPVKQKGSQEKQRELKLHSFPANYNTLILLLKFAVNIFLTVVGVGLGKIKKIERQKEKYEQAVAIIERMLKDDSSYKYWNDGQEPVKTKITKLSSQRITIPSMALLDMDGPPKQGQGKTGGQEPVTGAPRDMDSPSKQEKNPQEPHTLATADTPFLLAAKNGITGIIKIILKDLHIAIYDKDSEGRNVIMLAAKHRQMKVFDYLLDHIPEREFQHLDREGNNIIHLAAMLDECDKPTRIPGAALQMQWELKWFKYVKDSVPSRCFTHHVNHKGNTPLEIFAETHKSLMESGNTWLIKTSESCSVIAALIAGSAFATSSSVPGGINEETGRPILEGEAAFDVFSISSLIGLCLAVTALVFFLAIITSRGVEKDFKNNLPNKLLGGLSCLFVSIVAMLVTYCAGHTFVLKDQLKFAEIPIYAIACVPVSLYAFAQLELYADLVRAVCVKKPLSRGRI